MQKILKQRYPQEDEPKTLSDIGSDMKITQERVGQKEARALRRIRRLLEGKSQTGMGGRPPDDIDVSEVIRLYTEEEKTAKEISKLLMFDEKTVLSRLHSHKITMKPARLRLKYLDLDRATRLLNEGKPINEIARLLHSSRYIVADRLRKAGQQVPFPGRPRKK